MRFAVPQFIEYETKLIGPLSFRQFVFVAVAAVICVALYFLTKGVGFFFFLILAVIVLGIGASLAFLKINGQGLPTVLLNFFRFSLGSRFYIWKKEGALITFSKEMEIKKGGKEEKSLLKSTGTSRLRKIRTKIETETK